MAAAAKNATPGRRKKTDQQYFDVGKVGRKTGITLKDTGIRDEHGLEPVSGIFSSPADERGNRTLTSEGMDVQDSSAPDVTVTLAHRKTPRLPPPRQSTPKHTSIGGSPRRMSSARPVARHVLSEELTSSPRIDIAHQPNRRLDFGKADGKRKSAHVVETRSPFKPTHALRRSYGPSRPDAYDYPQDDEPTQSLFNVDEGDDEEDVEQSIEQDEPPIIIDDADPYSLDDEPTAATMGAEASQKGHRSPPRKSDQSSTSHLQYTPTAGATAPSGGSGTKRSRASLDHSRMVDESQPPSSKRKRLSKEITVHRDDHEESLDPSSIHHGDEYVVDGNDSPELQHDAAMEAQLDSQLEAEQSPEVGPKRGRGRPKGSKGKPKERDANRAMQKDGGPSKVNGSPSKVRGRGGSVGPISNVNLRATTPFEDAGNRASRFGRNLIQPLKFWENESVIWKSGEIEGIIRAEPVVQSRAKPKRKKKSRINNSRLHDIEEESETESILPDEWEEEMGVITGNVASWDPVRREGDPEDPVQEDIGFAANSIITRDVPGADFKYAKIMTIPFLGAGIVEIPPEGFKKAKNSRKMQMVFFVHEGKVMVEIGAVGMEVNQFALSKGGVWVVPRGNNYAITNESSTRAAKIFFAQGCLVQEDAGDA